MFRIATWDGVTLAIASRGGAGVDRTRGASCLAAVRVGDGGRPATVARERARRGSTVIDLQTARSDNPPKVCILLWCRSLAIRGQDL
jgi:hypothetical protein